MGILEKLRRFMYGRYGFDSFGGFLFGLSFLFWAICFILRFTPLYKAYFIFSTLNFLIYVYAIFRILSRNTYKRSLENDRYLNIRCKFMPFVDKLKQNFKDSEHVYKKCPNCKAQLRLKRIKGKHTTRCPRCGTKFKVRIFFERKKYDRYY